MQTVDTHTEIRNRTRSGKDTGAYAQTDEEALLYAEKLAVQELEKAVQDLQERLGKHEQLKKERVVIPCVHIIVSSDLGSHTTEGKVATASVTFEGVNYLNTAHNYFCATHPAKPPESFEPIIWTREDEILGRRAEAELIREIYCKTGKNLGQYTVVWGA